MSSDSGTSTDEDSKSGLDDEELAEVPAARGGGSEDENDLPSPSGRPEGGRELFEVRVPAVSATSDEQRSREQYSESRQGLHVTGGAETVADLLACAACKHWLQASLLLA